MILEILRTIAILCQVGAVNASAVHANNIQALCQRELLTCMGSPYGIRPEQKLLECARKRENK